MEQIYKSRRIQTSSQLNCDADCCPESIGGTPVTILIYVNDVDALVDQATAAGAKLMRPVEDQSYGGRVGVLEDPFGHSWSFATHIEDVSRWKS
jgi:PhnB protein